MYAYCLYSDHIQTKTILQLNRPNLQFTYTHKNCFFKNLSEDWWDRVCKEKVMEAWCSDPQWKERTSKSCVLTCARAHTQTHTQKKTLKSMVQPGIVMHTCWSQHSEKDQEFMGKFSVGQMRPGFKKHTENGWSQEWWLTSVIPPTRRKRQVAL